MRIPCEEFFLHCSNLFIKISYRFRFWQYRNCRKKKNDSCRKTRKFRLASIPANKRALTPFQTRRAALPPFEFALMFSIKSKGHSDGGRCARNPNRGHKPSKGSARIAAKCLSSCHYAAVGVARELPSRSQHWSKILSFDPEKRSTTRDWFSFEKKKRLLI